MRARPVEHKRRNDRPGSRKDRRTYPLGYSDGEFKRLEQQGAFLHDLTEDVLRRAGIAPGMRVLDIGCGVGDVSMLAGGLVGPSGEVLGIDRSPEAVAVARRRVAAVGQNWVRFAATAIETFSTIVTFDAVIGRLILMFLPDPAAALQRLCGYIRSGGIVVFQESAMPLARSIPDAPLFDQCINRITDTFARSGFETDMGGKLFATFLAAGLTVQQMIVAGRVEGGPHSAVYDYITGALRSLLPTMERVGVATAAEIDIDTLAERLRKEAVKCNACIMPPPLIGVWARTPA
jgi:SAM-dependent methyltransferase